VITKKPGFGTVPLASVCTIETERPVRVLFRGAGLQSGPWDETFTSRCPNEISLSILIRSHEFGLSTEIAAECSCRFIILSNIDVVTSPLA
jgi:hypothetical protein